MWQHNYFRDLKNPAVELYLVKAGISAESMSWRSKIDLVVTDIGERKGPRPSHQSRM